MCEEEENREEKMIRINWEERLRKIGDISMSVEDILGDEIPGSLELLPDENLEETDDLLKLPMEKWKVAVNPQVQKVAEETERGSTVPGLMIKDNYVPSIEEVAAHWNMPVEHVRWSEVAKFLYKEFNIKNSFPI